jgi:hypothetical protein
MGVIDTGALCPAEGHMQKSPDLDREIVRATVFLTLAKSLDFSFLETGSCHVSQAGLELMILLLQHLELRFLT